MQHLNQLIDSLNQDPLSGVSIFDNDLSKFVVRTIKSPEIIAQFGSSEAFFENLYANGHKNLRIAVKRKNGATYKTIAEFESTFAAPQTEVQPQPMAVNAQVVPQIQQPVQQKNDEGMFGLGALDIMNLVSDSRDAKRLQTENESLKRENETVKKDNDRIKEEQMLAKYTREGKEANQQMLVGAIQAMPMLIQMVKGGGNTEGLNAPAAPAYNTNTKTQFASQLNDTPDGTVQALANIAAAIPTNKDFAVELSNLLKKHNIDQ